MKKLLILYASKGGSTSEVARYIYMVLRQQDVDTTIMNVNEFDGDVQGYDGVIIGTPIYKGVWLTSIWRTMRRLESQLKTIPIWGFSLCMRVLEPNGHEYAQQHYLPHNVLDKLNLQEYRFFAGRIQNLTLSQKTEFYETYDGQIGRREGDYRDWQAIRAWAVQIAASIEMSAVG